MEKNPDQQLVFSFFRNHPLVTITTMSEQGIPESAAVYVFIDDNMNCYCVTRETTRKFKNIQNNGTAVISAYDENVLMFGELSGQAQVLEDGKEIAMVVTELQKIFSSRKSAYWVPPVSQLEGNQFVLLKLTPRKATYYNYEKSSSETPEPHKVTLNFDK